MVFGATREEEKKLNMYNEKYILENPRALAVVRLALAVTVLKLIIVLFLRQTEKWT